MKKFFAIFLAIIICFSLVACGNNETQSTDNSTKTTNSTETTRNEEIVLDVPITIIDNDEVTVKVTCFFREVFNEGKESEFCDAGFEVEVENKFADYNISLHPSNCSLSDRRVIEFASEQGGTIAPNKIATLRFIKFENGKSVDVEDLNTFYELEGYMNMSVTDSQYFYSDLGGDIEFSIPNSMNWI